MDKSSKCHLPKEGEVSMSSDEPRDISDSFIVVKSVPYENSDESADPLYCVMIDDEVLQTPKGNMIVHSEIRAIKELAGELEYEDKLDVSKVSLYNLCSTQLDVIEENGFSIGSDEIQSLVWNDSTLRLCAGPEATDQLKYLDAIVAFLMERGIQYPNFPQISISEDSWIKNNGIEYETNVEKLVEYVADRLSRLNPHQLTACVTAISLFNSVILGIMTAMGKISPHEFAIVYLSASCINSKVWGDTDRNEEREALSEITATAECLQRYLERFAPGVDPEVDDLLALGESKTIEFKSSLRYNIRAKRNDDDITFSCLKTIAAFLNTDGGILLIGVSDDSGIVGIEHDGFANSDKFLLHLYNVIKQSMGEDVASSLETKVDSKDGKTICIISCPKSTKPVFLSFKQKEDEFYIRTGPGSTKLPLSKAHDFISKQFSTSHS
jgi:chaperone required for assembly of F1-ATPase